MQNLLLWNKRLTDNVAIACLLGASYTKDVKCLYYKRRITASTGEESTAMKEGSKNTREGSKIAIKDQQIILCA